ncbi:hypothetical protein MRB53_031647 [Persea americana]|uniref:Uncharacterized protein n=1 Tax=Persea americana TaxID=3435 RepID=A0ACC2KPY2_PERAE|nr:hypothetical protein MRB53_031647 [Persea americana]
MAISSARKLCQNLIALSIQRCRISNNLCRLSIVLKSPTEFNPPLLRVTISDTGAGSSLAEFKCMDWTSSQVSAETWDGVLSITTTSICDNEIHHYCLSFKETIATRRLSRLPTTPKNGRKFSGSEVSFTVQESIDDFVVWITQLCQKISILKIPIVAVELLVEQMNGPGSRCDHLLLAKDGILLPLSMPSIERLASGLEDYVLKHGNAVDKECQDCFSSREQLKVGRGVACSGPSVKTTVQMAEAVIVITEVPESSKFSCLRACSKMTEVLTPQMHKRTQCDRNLVKKAVKIALDDLKAKYTGLFLSSHALKIRGYAPDLSRAIAGLILSSNDKDFQGECASLLGLQPEDIRGEGIVDSCIREKIIGVIEMNDIKPKYVKEYAPHLFEDNSIQKEESQDEEDEGAKVGNCLKHAVGIKNLSCGKKDPSVHSTRTESWILFWAFSA